MRVLKKGMQGPEVKKWQNFLAGQGYTYVIADGDFGSYTHKAKIDFQKENNLSADRILGKQTLIIAM
jgi:peptidoglycan hydrolase-like protein with peptidoglycan-binding domain